MKLTNRNNLPEPFVAVCESDYRPTPNRYSITTLMKPTGQTILQRRYGDQVEDDIVNRTWAMFGQMFHALMEDVDVSGYQEMYLEAPILGSTVSGILDYYDPATATVHDYKTTTVYKYKSGDFSDYKRQLEGYAYLLAVNGFPVKHLEADLIFRDFQKSRAVYDSDYPKDPIMAVRWDFSPCSLLRVKKWLEERIIDIKRHEDMDDNRLPICSPEERWHEPDIWKIRDKGKKRARKRCYSEEEANTYLETKGGDYIEFVPGKDKRCDAYCAVKGWCRYGKATDCQTD